MMAFIVMTIFGLAFLGIGGCLVFVLKGKHQGPPPVDEPYNPFGDDDRTSPIRDHMINNVWFGIDDDHTLNGPFENDLMSPVNS